MNPPDAIVAASSDVVVPLVIALLIVIGVVLVGVAFWLVRRTRPEPELLAPLEAMGARRWRSVDADARRQQLDDLRPEGAEPLPPADDGENVHTDDVEDTADDEFDLLRPSAGYPVYDHGRIVDATPPEQQRPDENQPSLFDVFDDDLGDESDDIEEMVSSEPAESSPGDGVVSRIRGVLRRWRS